MTRFLILGKPFVILALIMKIMHFQILLLALFAMQDYGRSQFGAFTEYRASGKSIVFMTYAGFRLKLTPYGTGIIRIQAARKGEDFFRDDRYEMVQSHHWNGRFTLHDNRDAFTLECAGNRNLEIILKKEPMRLEFRHKGTPILSEKNGIEWDGNVVGESFSASDNEHFTGLGHGFFGRASGIDLRGRRIGRNYGAEHGDQAPLLVPFYLSSNGYGIFLNSTFPNEFSFDSAGEYGFSINTYGAGGGLDFFFLLGPSFGAILDRYTQLTGRPRIPPLAIFGLGLSDKSNDENSTDPSDEKWWKRKVREQRDAGLPLDHLINDNRWRAGGGKRCESYFDWDKERYPDPAEYARWLNENGLITTIDFNRCIGAKSEGWNASYNIPFSEKVDHNECVPDFTRKDVREWFWGIFWKKSLRPELHFPGDALWIDEFDELGPIADTVTLGNGRTWGEMKNYWPFLIAKSLVQEGWDKNISPRKRPFVWVRGMTAGAQRYTTLWTGDIRPTFEDMRHQIIAMQLAGLSGFPYEGHDAGGFYDWTNKKGPDEELYRRWSMAFGCFTPFWKPHGWGQSRWPLDRSPESIETAKRFTSLRYALLPYTYTLAHESHRTGMPMARAMVIGYRDNPLAWKSDLQYMWGDAMLVVPTSFGKDTVNAWLPPGNWYDYWTNTVYAGDTTMDFFSPAGDLVLLVKQGTLLPMTHPALSTAFVDKSVLDINIYTGRNGKFTLYDDDGITENFETGARQETKFSFSQSTMEFRITGARGTYDGAPKTRSYSLHFIGVKPAKHVLANGKMLARLEQRDSGTGFYQGDGHNTLIVNIMNVPVSRPVKVRVVE